MKNIIKKFTASVLLLAMVFTCMPAMESKAASIEPYSKNQTIYWNPSSGYVSEMIWLNGVSKASSIKSLKCSNSKFKARAKNGYIDVYATAPGKTKVSFTVGSKNLSTNLTVLDYVNPFSTLKIGDTSYVSKFKNSTRYYSTKGFSKKKLSVKMKSGWKISSLSVTNGNTYNSYYLDKSSVTKTITCNKEYSYIDVTVYNTTNNAYLSFEINIL